MIKNKTIKSRVVLFGILTSVVEVELTLAVNHDNVCFLKSYWVTWSGGQYGCDVNEDYTIPDGIEYQMNWYFDKLGYKIARRFHMKTFFMKFEDFKNWVFNKECLNSDVDDDIGRWED